MYGHVVDFIHFHIEDIFHWPIFNIADVLLFVGYLILFLQYGFRRNEKLNQKSL
jgi:signal peptidase II